MPTYPITLETQGGEQIRVGRAGMTNRSPLVPADKSLIWNLVSGGAEMTEIIEKVRTRRQQDGLAEVDARWVRVAVTWTRKSMKRDMEAQKLNSPEEKRNRRIVKGLIEEYEQITAYCTNAMIESPEVIRQDWYQEILNRKLRLFDRITKFTGKGKSRETINSEDLKHQKENNPFEQENKYSGRLPAFFESSAFLPEVNDHSQKVNESEERKLEST